MASAQNQGTKTAWRCQCDCYSRFQDAAEARHRAEALTHDAFLAEFDRQSAENR